MIRVGIIGCGTLGQIHANNLFSNPQVSIEAVNDRSTLLAQKTALYYEAEVCSITEILKSSSIDALIIASPTETHIPIATNAIIHNKAVFCEQPLDFHIPEARMLAQLVKSENAIFMSGFNRRFDPEFLRFNQQLCDIGKSRIEQLTIISRDPCPPTVDKFPASGGMLMDMSIHDFDMARYLLDEDPVEIFTTGDALFDEDILNYHDIDTATIVMKTQKNQQIQIISSRRAIYGLDQRVEAFGDFGLLQLNNFQPSQIQHFGHKFAQLPLPASHCTERYAQAFKNEIDEFIRCVECNAEPSCTIHDGLKAIEIAQAAYDSLLSGSAVTLEKNSTTGPTYPSDAEFKSILNPAVV